MKKTFLSFFLAAMLLLPGFVAKAGAPSVPDREMRSAWVATVWRLDWPQTVIRSTGNTNDINKQKTQMIQLLDSLYVNNFNAINFQVRSRSDAFYRSSYEPWSSDLVETRGMDPGYDPLEFVVEECHKRGMECHAWVNPYRYESVQHQWDGTPMNYRESHPDWVMDVGNAAILNPGIPAVTEHICNIIKEIVQNYDVDGVLFDDYFYLSGTTTAHDGDLYNAYKAAGGTLSIGNWRRANVNAMVAAVNNAIKSVKPWVRFGVSPAGIACTSQSVANQYGVTPCPVGSDWQYNDIYSDPLAWISQQSLDFISPQIYWSRGSSTAYGPATKWWSQIAHKWNRHLYVSHSISDFTAASQAPGLSALESSLIAQNDIDEAEMAVFPQDPEYSYGPNGDSFQEHVEQVYLNREYNLDNAPGSIFYSCKYIYRTAPLFGNYLKKHAFQTRCLIPAMPWLSIVAPAAVENVQVAGSKLKWDAQENMRYTIYAYPNNLPTSQWLRDPEHLLDVVYTNEYTMADKYVSGYTLGVCAYDRYGNESPLTLPGEPAGTLAAPILGVPAASSLAEAPFNFSWSEVENAVEYVVEIGYDTAMTQMLDQRSTLETNISSVQFRQMPLDTPLYWRVRACCPGYRDGVAASVPFTITEMRILLPAAGEVAASLTPEFTYSIGNREVTLEISTENTFENEEIVYTNTHTGNHTVALYTLAGATEYFARLQYEREGEHLTSAMISFKTPEAAAVAPEIAFPVAGGDFYADSHIVLAGVEGPSQIRVEVSTSDAFSPRQTYSTVRVNTQTLIDPNTGDDIKINGSKLVDGQTYYARARAVYKRFEGSSETTKYGQAVPFTYHASNSGVADVAVKPALTVQGGVITADCDLEEVVVVASDGHIVASPGHVAAGTSVDLNLGAGVYIIKAKQMQSIKIQL